MRNAIVACYLAMSGCAFALPPTRTEVGRTARPDYNGTQVAVGASVASALPATKSRFELGGGIIARSREEAGQTALPWQKGAFIDLGYAVLNSTNARVIVGARGEHFGGAGDIQVAKLRIDAEVLTHVTAGGASASSCGGGIGGATGNVGLGLFAEAGRVFGDRMDDPRALGWTASAGVSVRLPLMGGIAFSGKNGGCSSSDSGGSWRAPASTPSSGR